MSQANLETLRTNVETELVNSSGRHVMQGGGGDASFAKQWSMPLLDLLDEINLALERIAPNTYTPQVRRTRQRFDS